LIVTTLLSRSVLMSRMGGWPKKRLYGQQFVQKRLQQCDFHPDTWGPHHHSRCTVASDRYSYRQLDDFTDLIQRSLQRVPPVAKVTRAGVLPEEIYLEYSQERLASYG